MCFTTTRSGLYLLESGQPGGDEMQVLEAEPVSGRAALVQQLHRHLRLTLTHRHLQTTPARIKLTVI